MKDQRVSGSGKGKQIPAKLIVQSDELTNGIWGKPLEETAQSRFVGQLLQAQQPKKEAIVLKLVGFVDALHSYDQKTQQQKN